MNKILNSYVNFKTPFQRQEVSRLLGKISESKVATDKTHQSKIYTSKLLEKKLEIDFLQHLIYDYYQQSLSFQNYLFLSKVK